MFLVFPLGTAKEYLASLLLPPYFQSIAIGIPAVSHLKGALKTHSSVGCWQAACLQQDLYRTVGPLSLLV